MHCSFGLKKVEARFLNCCGRLLSARSYRRGTEALLWCQDLRGLIIDYFELFLKDTLKNATYPDVVFSLTLSSKPTRPSFILLLVCGSVLLLLMLSLVVLACFIFYVFFLMSKRKTPPLFSSIWFVVFVLFCLHFFFSKPTTKGLAEMGFTDVAPSDGAFYVYADVSDLVRGLIPPRPPESQFGLLEGQTAGLVVVAFILFVNSSRRFPYIYAPLIYLESSMLDSESLVYDIYCAFCLIYEVRPSKSLVPKPRRAKGRTTRKQLQQTI